MNRPSSHQSFQFTVHNYKYLLKKKKQSWVVKLVTVYICTLCTYRCIIVCALRLGAALAYLLVFQVSRVQAGIGIFRICSRLCTYVRTYIILSSGKFLPTCICQQPRPSYTTTTHKIPTRTSLPTGILRLCRRMYTAVSTQDSVHRDNVLYEDDGGSANGLRHSESVGRPVGKRFNAG